MISSSGYRKKCRIEYVSKFEWLSTKWKWIKKSRTEFVPPVTMNLNNITEKPFLSSHVSSPRGHEISVLPLRSRHSEGRGCRREIGLARTLTARPSCCRGSVFLVTCVGKIISRKCAFSSRAVWKVPTAEDTCFTGYLSPFPFLWTGCQTEALQFRSKICKCKILQNPRSLLWSVLSLVQNRNVRNRNKGKYFSQVFLNPNAGYFRLVSWEPSYSTGKPSSEGVLKTEKKR